MWRSLRESIGQLWTHRTTESHVESNSESADSLAATSPMTERPQGRIGPKTRRQEAQRSTGLQWDVFIGTGVPPPMSFLSVRELARCELVSPEFRRMATAPDALREARLSFPRVHFNEDFNSHPDFTTESEADEYWVRKHDDRMRALVARSEAELKYLARRLTPGIVQFSFCSEIMIGGWDAADGEGNDGDLAWDLFDVFRHHAATLRDINLEHFDVFFVPPQMPVLQRLRLSASYVVWPDDRTDFPSALKQFTSNGSHFRRFGDTYLLDENGNPELQHDDTSPSYSSPRSYIQQDGLPADLEVLGDCHGYHSEFRVDDNHIEALLGIIRSSPRLRHVALSIRQASEALHSRVWDALGSCHSLSTLYVDAKSASLPQFSSHRIRVDLLILEIFSSSSIARLAQWIDNTFVKPPRIILSIDGPTQKKLNVLTDELEAASLHTRYNIEIELRVKPPAKPRAKSSVEVGYRSIATDAWEAFVPRIFPSRAGRFKRWPLWTPPPPGNE